MFEIAEYLGLVAFALSGFLVATRNKLDLLGILISTFLTALGGGVMRDVIVGRIPFAFTHNTPAMVIFGLLILMIFFGIHKKESLENRFVFILSDSLGLASFSITGALIAIEHQLNLTGILVVSFVTAVGGGITRDVIINEVPFIFKSGFYGSVALIVGACIYLLDAFESVNFITLSSVFVFAVSLRMMAHYKKWSIPLR